MNQGLNQLVTKSAYDAQRKFWREYTWKNVNLINLLTISKEIKRKENFRLILQLKTLKTTAKFYSREIN